MAEVLLMEDDTDFRSQFRKGLEDAGHEVVEVSDGKEGMVKFRDRQPDMVITDIVMDNGEGTGVLLEIREVAPQVPVITISGNVMYLSSSRRLGAAKALLKHFRMTELLDSVESALAA